MKFGYTVENFNANLDRDYLIKTAQIADEAGFESLWTVDHIMQPNEKGLTIFEETTTAIYNNIAEPLTTISFLAGQTNKIKFGISTLVLPIRNPIIVAKQLATLDFLTNGRVVMTFGAGWNETEFSFLGESFKKRGSKLREGLQIIRALWNGETSFEGRYYQFQNVSFKPLRSELSQLPLIVAGTSEYMVETAIKFGDGLHPAGATGKEIQEIISPYENQLEGREFFLSVHFDVFKDTDLESVINEYEENGIHRVVLDVTRGDIKPEARMSFLENLCDFVKKY
ncbi:MAG: LLM class flavin-dependent oxidoreductase [Candidatus Heimdallarchaeota archaeon]|nr:LLM class flavin-dependent oxidoreductase [Candidatus Heimdallarchaeota archaeon]MCK4877431.1 LLM class flavin-dependent oxidoreductase [Candidatus Heimdallarchaeota archaeon]